MDTKSPTPKPAHCAIFVIGLLVLFCWLTGKTAEIAKYFPHFEYRIYLLHAEESVEVDGRKLTVKQCFPYLCLHTDGRGRQLLWDGNDWVGEWQVFHSTNYNADPWLMIVKLRRPVIPAN
jgi:hypothetical protein